MWTAAFWKAVLERATKSAAQGVLVFWGVGDALLNAWDVDLAQTGGVALGMAAVSVLTSLVSGAITNGSPSVTGAEVPADQVVVRTAPADAGSIRPVAGPASPLTDGTPVEVSPA